MIGKGRERLIDREKSSKWLVIMNDCVPQELNQGVYIASSRIANRMLYCHFVTSVDGL